jgi:hypothetical protein
MLQQGEGRPKGRHSSTHRIRQGSCCPPKLASLPASAGSGTKRRCCVRAVGAPGVRSHRHRGKNTVWISYLCPKVYRRPVSNPHSVGDTMWVRSPRCSNGLAQRCPNKILARGGLNGDKHSSMGLLQDGLQTVFIYPFGLTGNLLRLLRYHGSSPLEYGPVATHDVEYAGIQCTRPNPKNPSATRSSSCTWLT